MPPKRKAQTQNTPAPFDSTGNAARLAYITYGAIALSHQFSSRRAESDMHPLWNYETAKLCGKHLGRVINVPQFRVWLRSGKQGNVIVNVPLSAASNETTPLTRDQLERIPDWIIMFPVLATDAATLETLLADSENDLVQPYFSVAVGTIYIPLVMEIKPMVKRSHRDIIYYVRQILSGLDAAKGQVDGQANIILLRKKYQVLWGPNGPEILEYACCGQYYQVRLRKLEEMVAVIPVVGAGMTFEEAATKPGRSTRTRLPGSSASQRDEESDSDSEDDDAGADLDPDVSDDEMPQDDVPVQRQDQAQERDERHEARDAEADARDEQARKEDELIRRAGPNPDAWTAELLEEAYLLVIIKKSKLTFFQPPVKNRASITKLLRAEWSRVICLGSPVSKSFEAYVQVRIDELVTEQ